MKHGIWNYVKCVSREKIEKDEAYFRGSFTVEMSLLMPLILFLIMECMLASFYYHDKNILAGAAYETVVVGSTKAREKDGVEVSELETLCRERIGRKCILFSGVKIISTVEEDEIRIIVKAKKRRFSVSVESSAAVTKPEKYIRDIRRIKK